MKAKIICLAAALALAACGAFVAYKSGYTAGYDTAIDYAAALVTPTPAPTAAPIPTPEPTPPLTPTPEPPERKILPPPYLEKLDKLDDGTYSDGRTIYTIDADGSVEFLTHKYYADRELVTLKKKPAPEADKYRLDWQSEEYAQIEEKAAQIWLDLDIEFGLVTPVYKIDDTYYVSSIPIGGGSGERWMFRDDARFISISSDGDYKDYGNIRAAHVTYHNGYFYYVELHAEEWMTPGNGTIIRMNLDGSGKKTLVSDVTIGPFRIYNNRIYFLHQSDERAYTIKLDGTDRQAVNDRILPFNDYIRLEFYDDIIINKHWTRSGEGGNSSGMTESWTTSPAIMDKNGNNLVTFPTELTFNGFPDSGYEVINWGADHMFFREAGTDNYWVYVKDSSEP